VDGRNIHITNDNGDHLDDFTAPRDFTNGRISVKCDGLFLVRGE
jgi:hypothetical protein